MRSWYYVVSQDMSQIPACIDYYEDELAEARRELSLKGKAVERHSAELAGLVEYRFNQLQEIEAILEFLNVQLKKTRTEKFKKFLEHYNRALTSRDAEKYVDGEVDVVNMALLVNEFALLRNKFLGISKGLDTKNWMIGHITRLRCAGLDDVQVE